MLFEIDFQEHKINTLLYNKADCLHFAVPTARMNHLRQKYVLLFCDSYYLRHAMCRAITFYKIFKRNPLYLYSIFRKSFL